MRTRNYFCIFGLLLLFSCSIHAQVPMWTWARSGGGNLYETGNGVAADASGNVYMVGSFKSATASFGAQQLNNAMADSLDLFVVKYDYNGNVLWAKRAGGVRNDEATAIAIDNNDEITVTGYFYSSTITFGTTILTNTSGYSDAFVVHYDASGNVVFAKSFGGQYDDRGSSIAIAQNNQPVVTGYFLADTLFCGTDTLLCMGTYDAFVIRFDGSGNFVWATSIGTSNDERGTAITTDDLGQNIYVAGTFQGTLMIGSTTLNYAGGAYSDIFLTCYQSGTVQWAIAEGGTYLDEATGLTTDPSGNVIMCANVYSAYIIIGNDSLPNSGSSFYCDVVVAKFNSNGVPQWAAGGGVGTGNDIVTGITTDLSGDIYICGLHGPNCNFGFNYLSGTGTFVVRYNSGGGVFWAVSVDGTMANGITCGFSDQLAICGFLYDPTASFDTYTITNAGVYDAFAAWMVQVLDVPGTNDDQHIDVFPNPTNGWVSITGMSAMQETKVRLLSSTGQLLNEWMSRESSTAFDLSQYDRGVYFLEIDGQSRKIVLY